MKKNNSNSVENVVFNCFIRVIKTDGKYILFRRSVNNDGLMNALLKKKSCQRSDNPFAFLSSKDEIITKLEKITNDMAISNGHKKGIKGLDKYEHVTMTINHLLHFFMELNGVPMEKLCSLGEEIYGLSCYKLFGDEIEETVENQTEEKTIKSDLFQDYINGIKDGRISKKVTFDEFVKKVNEFDSNAKVTVNDTKEIGYVLGSIPDDNAFIDAVQLDKTYATNW